MRHAHGWQTFALSILSVILYSLAESIESNGLYAASFVCGAFAFFIFAWIAADVVVDLYDRARTAASITTRAVELDKAARLTAEQAKAVPAMAYHAVLGMALNRKGEWSFLLMTKDGSIPYEWCQKFLFECSQTRLRSIRSYVNGTQAQHYAQWFTSWLREQNFAVGGEDGSGKAAEWINEQAYWEARRLFRIEPDDIFEQSASLEIPTTDELDEGEPTPDGVRVYASKV